MSMSDEHVTSMCPPRDAMRNGIGIATRVLLVNSVVSIFALIAQITSLIVYGPTHEYWALCLVLMFAVFAVSLIAQWAVRQSLLVGMNFYAWSCYACVMGMVYVDLTLMSDRFPIILFVLTLGVLGLGLTVGYRGSVPFAAICSLSVFSLGLISGSDIDNSVVAVTLLAATAMMSSENAHTARRLDHLEHAVGAYIDAKRRLRQDTTAHGSGES